MRDRFECEEQNRILALWCTPRTRSTAFLWMMKQRGDFVVLQEPFEMSAHCSEERISDRLAHSPPQPEYNYQTVLRNLLSASEKERLFVKDHAYYFIHIVDDRFLSNFQSTFLIRDPAQMLPSYFYKWPDPRIEDTGYKELYRMFEKVADFSGRIPVLIDADDLVRRPAATVQIYCERVGIPFIPEALDWKPPGAGQKIGWWDGGSWHDHLRTSHGFHEQINTPYLNVDENDDLKRLYDLCMPYYEKLHSHRLHIRGL